MTSRRLESDAKIVLQRAGYSCFYKGCCLHYMKTETAAGKLRCSSGTVDNVKVVELLKLAGCDEWGYRK